MPTGRRTSLRHAARTRRTRVQRKQRQLLCSINLVPCFTLDRAFANYGSQQTLPPTHRHTRKYVFSSHLPHLLSLQSFQPCRGVPGPGIPCDAAGRDVTCRYPRRAFHPLYSGLTPASGQRRGRSGSLGKLGRATDAFLPPLLSLPALPGCMGASYGESTFHYNAPTLPLWSTNPESPEPETRLAQPEK